MKNKRLFLFILSVLMAMPLLAQYAIFGEVKDVNDIGLQNVTIRLFAEDSSFVKGTITDSLGNYYLNGINVKRGYIIRSCIGFKTTHSNFDFSEGCVCKDSSLMLNDTKVLDEINVTASSFSRQHDCWLIVPDRKQTNSSYTAYDLLHNLMIPGIYVDRKNREVLSCNEKVTLYIDGQKADAYDIRALRSRDIARIEYHDLPTGKYTGDFASINFITKNYKSGGYVVLDARQTIGYEDGQYNFLTKVVSGNTSYRIATGWSGEDNSGTWCNNVETFHMLGVNVERKYETVDAHVRKKSQYSQLEIQNKKTSHSLSMKIGYIRNNYPKDFHAGELEYSNGQKLYANKSNANSGKMPTLDIYGRFKLKSNQFVEASLKGKYSDNRYAYTYVEDGNDISTITKENMYGIDANINYGLKLRNKSSFTVKVLHLHTISQATYASSTQHLWTGETLLFFEYSKRFRRGTTLTAVPGISSLQYKLRGTDRIGQTYPRLQLSLSHPFSSQHLFQLKVNVGNSFPAINTLNQAEQVIDFLQKRRGNPDLKMTKAYYLTGIYAYNSKKIRLQVMGTGRFYQDMSVSDCFMEENMVVHSFRSDVNWRHIIGSLSMTCKLTDDFHVKADGGFSFFDYYGGVNKTMGVWNGQLQINYYHKNLLFNLYGKTTNGVLGTDLTEVRLPVYYGLSVNWNRRGWSVEIGVDNPFSHQIHYVSRYDNGICNFRKSWHSKTDQMSAYIRMAYSLDFKKKMTHDSIQMDKQINSAILKAE